MSDKTNAKNRLAEMYPVKMAAGGVIGNMGILGAAAMGVKPKYNEQEQAYIDAYSAYRDKYNAEYLPKYEAVKPEYDAWEKEYNRIADEINAGKYDIAFKLRSDSNKGWDEWNNYFYNLGYTGDFNTLRPGSVEAIYKTPSPLAGVPVPEEPVVPTGVNQDELTARQQEASRRKSGLSIFANPNEYNLAGFAGLSAFKDGGEVDKEEATSEDIAISRKNLLDTLLQKQIMHNIMAEMPSVNVSPSLMAGTFEDKNAKGNYYDVGADISLGDKVGLGASGRGTSVKFDGGKFKENVLSQLRGSYITDDGIQYAAEYSPVGNPGQLDPTQTPYRLSRRNLNDQSEISLSHEPGRRGLDMPGQAPEPGTTDTTWLRYAKEF